MKHAIRVLLPLLLFLSAAGASAGDRETILSTLKQYSPDGFHIVDTFGKRTGGTDFMEYWDPSSEDSRWDSYNTIVHEMAHGYMMALADRDSLCILASRNERIMVPLTEVFFSREMVPSFPKELRTFRFDYVDCQEDELGAQAHGAYGLLDEMAAYYLGTKTSWELLPCFQAQGAKAPWGSFFQSVNGTLYGILEFKLYVLKYLLYAQRNKPAVYRGIMENGQFAKAFLAVDRASTAFIRDYFAGKETVYESLRKLGFEAREDGRSLILGKDGQTVYYGTFLDVYTLLAKELEKPEYRDLMRSLNAGAAVEPSPTAVAASAAPPGAASKAGSAAVAAQRDSALSTMEDIRATKSGSKAAASGAGAGAGLSRSGEDAPGDARPDFIDITRADVKLFPDMLIVGISFAAFPGKLLFNNPNLEENAVEYEWSCRIDLEGDGRPDYSISMSAFKAPGAKPVEASVTLFCQADLWKLSGSGGESVEARVKAETEGSALFLTLYDSAALPLKRLGARTKFTVGAYHDNGKGGVEDDLRL